MENRIIPFFRPDLGFLFFILIFTILLTVSANPALAQGDPQLNSNTIWSNINSDGVTLNSPANIYLQDSCSDRCRVGKYVCLRDQIPAHIGSNSRRYQALVNATEVAVRCVQYSEGYCHSQCASVQQKLAEISSTYDLAAINAQGEEIAPAQGNATLYLIPEAAQIYAQIRDHLCMDNTPFLSRTVCINAWQKHLLPGIPPVETWYVLPHRRDGGSNNLGNMFNRENDLNCDERCTLQEFLCFRDQIPQGISGGNITQDDIRPADLVAQGCRTHRSQCTNLCAACANCRAYQSSLEGASNPAIREAYQQVLDEYQCDTIQCD